MECYYMEDRVALWLAGHRHGSHGEIKRQGAALIRVTSLRPAGGSLARWGYPQLAGWFLWTGKYHRSKWMMTRGTPMTMESLIFLDTLYQEWWKIDMRDHSYMIVRIKRNWILTYVDRFFETEQTKTLRRSTHGTCVFSGKHELSTEYVHTMLAIGIQLRWSSSSTNYLGAHPSCYVIVSGSMLNHWWNSNLYVALKNHCKYSPEDFPEVPNSMGQKMFGNGGVSPL